MNSGKHLSIVSMLARGRAYTVWRADDGQSHECVLKLPAGEGDKLAAATLSLQREGQVLRLLQHPHVVRTYGSCSTSRVSGWPESVPEGQALVLEYLPGGSLEPLAGQRPRHWIRCAFELLSVLDLLHERDIVHGDIKAKNVMFDAADRSRLIDFSCASRIGDRFTKPFGTVEFQRERSFPHIADSDDDLYAYATVLYELMTGELPLICGHEPLSGRENWPPAPHERVNFNRTESVLLDVILGKLGTPAAPLGPDREDFRAALSALASD